MIELRGVGVTYAGASRPSLRDVDLRIEEGELVLIVGPTGSGKSTLLRTLNGLVPHFSGGTLTGSVVVGGRDTRAHRPRDLADLVGFVVQDPTSAFVTDTVEDEIAYGMETLGVEPTAMRRRLEETLDIMGLAELRDRSLRELSGGQQQRVSIAAVLAAGPRVLVLDEPTSALDPVAAEEVLSALHRLVHDLGYTVVLAEHRLERVVQHADRIVLVRDGVVSAPLDPAEAMALSPVHPPIVELGRRMGWSPLPLTIRDARRRAGSLRARLAALDGTPAASAPVKDAASRSLVSVNRLVVRRGTVEALSKVTLGVSAGSVTAVMGRNGAGKSTLLAAMAGQLAATSGEVSVAGSSPRRLAPHDRVRVVGLVPQDSNLLLYADSVAAECRAADRDFAAADGTTRALLARIAGEVDGDQHPRDLSEGQRLALALAIILAGRPQVVLLDEPTRGLDYPAKRRLVGILRDLAAEGHAVIVATHDVELVAEVAQRVIVLAEGEVVVDGPIHEVLTGSPAFAPQVAKILHPLPLLTVDDVSAALVPAS
ncbi:MAG TPA: ATP-binding cassette domain-containing protein [Dermatophilaceae bacterium]|jgi:energy-coupling factor transport system ATP-binding protein|uniref:ATP-binding cassette domain-containing protein n=1 Tax=Candidatus Phosphoribacter hodrii TaxID=2953743 RepID=A0A9D7XVD4_9MICO|nr:ATP-binding cassette domain-containing protein [Candidatus Phosphoribacter hodrii]HNV13324.1 ATP-binding cassette domain-containing protein [Dermatophilaceae bacterium]HOA01500.1 ATP-binding cassette domain-containing protein [Dermatophilaceae bacterium]HOA56819.1 ATP-binding cassette domain-containing protein [Dermatophilaceae bacterium]HOF35355.1 ATP-binding cassette domain-containing protein [Dermatophilaceae bacterium]